MRISYDPEVDALSITFLDTNMTIKHSVRSSIGEGVHGTPYELRVLASLRELV